MATITKTIGTSGRDYSTIQAWEDDLDSIHSSGDHAVGAMYNDSTFTSTVTINGGGGAGVASVTLKAADGERHDGTAGTGVTISPSSGSTAITVSTIQNCRIDGIEIDLNGSSAWTAVNMGQKGNGATRCIAYGGESSNVAAVFNGNHFGTSGAPYCYFANCIAYNFHSYKSGGSGVTYAAFGANVGRGANLYNCTSFNGTSGRPGTDVAVGMQLGVTPNIKNCVATDSNDSDFTGSATAANNNASSDGTVVGTSSLTSITTADQFISTLGGSEDLHLKAGSDCINAGVNLGSSPAGVNIDINGLDRGNRSWDIGAHEYENIVEYTIGTDSRDYSAAQAWEDDLDSAHSIGDTAKGVCYNDSTFTAGATINGGTSVGLDEVILSVAESDRHDGTAGTGARIVTSSGNGIITISRSNTSVEWLEFDGNGARHDSTIHLGGGTLLNVSAKNNIIHNAWCWSVGGGVYSESYTGQKYIQNCIVYDVQIRTSSDSTGGIAVRSAYGYTTINNCTVHNIVSYDTPASQTGYGISFPDASTVSVRNCLSTDAEDSCFRLSSFSSATVSNNASSDASAAGGGSLTSITTADQYVSTTGGSEDLHLKAGADAIDAGVTLGASFAVDINGRNRIAEGDTWDIGAHEYVAAGPTFNPAWANGSNSIIGGVQC